MRLLIVCIAMMTSTLWTNAHADFACKSPTGQMLFYQFVADSGAVRVTHPGSEWPYYGKAKPVGSLVIPDEVLFEGRRYAVVEVGANAFYRCDGLEAVVLPRGCRRIGAQAFNGCTALGRVRLPEGLVEVGEGAFAYCRSLREVLLPPSVQRLGISAFAMCSGLERLRMGASLWARRNRLTFLGCPLAEEGKNAENGPSETIFLQR